MTDASGKVNENADEPGDGVPGPLARPTQVQATRTRMQGNGVGADEIDLQRDPTAGKPSEERTADE